MRGKEGAISPVATHQLIDHRQPEHDVGARPRLQVQAGGARQRRAARIDHRHEGAGAPRGAHLRHQVDAGGRRVDAPQDDGTREPVILRWHTAHRAVHGARHGAGRRGAERSQQLRGAEAVEEARVGGAFAEHAVGAAVVIRQDRLGAVGGDDLLPALGDDVEGIVPA